MKRRLLILLVCVPALVAVLSSGASAVKPIPTVDVTQEWNGCNVTVTVTWSNLSGRVVVSPAALDEFSATYDAFPSPLTGGHSGTFSHTFSYSVSTVTYDWQGMGIVARSDGTPVTDTVFTPSQTVSCSKAPPA